MSSFDIIPRNYNYTNIIRYLTDDEINMFDTQIIANKYNI